MRLSSAFSSVPPELPRLSGFKFAKRFSTSSKSFANVLPADAMSSRDASSAVGQRDTARSAPEQRTLGLKFEPLDLLAYRRLR